MQSPLFTIVVPAYNRANFIGITIDSFLKQDFADWELIVVDDGSTDNTDEVVGKYTDPRISYFKKKNEERAAARNFGANKAKGRYINFFDSDDFALAHHLVEAKKCIEELEEPEFFHLGYRFETPENEFISQVEDLPPIANAELHDRNFLGCCGVFVRKDVALENPFNADRGLSASEDWELWLRLAARYPLHTRREVTSVVIDHEERSVRTINAPALILRKQLMVKYAFEDERVKAVYGQYERLMKAKASLYVALHLALTGKHKAAAIKHTFRALFTHPAVLKKRMFLGTMKHWLLTW